MARGPALCSPVAVAMAARGPSCGGLGAVVKWPGGLASGRCGPRSLLGGPGTFVEPGGSRGRPSRTFGPGIFVAMVRMVRGPYAEPGGSRGWPSCIFGPGTVVEPWGWRGWPSCTCDCAWSGDRVWSPGAQCALQYRVIRGLAWSPEAEYCTPRHARGCLYVGGPLRAVWPYTPRPGPPSRVRARGLEHLAVQARSIADTAGASAEH